MEITLSIVREARLLSPQDSQREISGAAHLRLPAALEVKMMPTETALQLALLAEYSPSPWAQAVSLRLLLFLLPAAQVEPIPLQVVSVVPHRLPAPAIT